MTKVPQFDPGGDRVGRYIHADAVVIGETGILIRGPSGAGKSRLALAITSTAEAHGYFARLVGDDRIYLERTGERLIARGHPAIQGAIEWRGRGIFRTRFLGSVVLGLVVDLASSNTEPRYPEAENLETQLEGVSLPAMTLPAALGPSGQAAYVLQHFRLRRQIHFSEADSADTIP